MIFANPMHRPCPWEVGDILTTENATPPAQRWPGTQWVQITDRFLYGSTAAGTEGGEATHTLTENEMPGHRHPNGCRVQWYNNAAKGFQVTWIENANLSIDKETIYTAYVGGNQPHNNMPPYRSVYMWRRTA